MHVRKKKCMSSVHVLTVSHSLTLAGKELEAVRSPRKTEDSQQQKKEPPEPEILLSDGIHFPSHKVHLHVSAGGKGPNCSLLLLAGYRSTAGGWLDNSGSRKRGDITRDYKVMRCNL